MTGWQRCSGSIRTSIDVILAIVTVDVVCCYYFNKLFICIQLVAYDLMMMMKCDRIFEIFVYARLIITFFFDYVEFDDCLCVKPQ
jgi:hypothetical protein